MINLVDRLQEDGGVVIFLFHGVIEKQRHQVRNYTRKHLPMADFRAALEALGRRGRPVSMDDVVAGCASGRPFPPRSFAITFDDGFENNASVARPLLDDMGIPATVYVTSRFVDEGGMSWIDRIEWAFERVSRASVILPWSPKAVAIGSIESKISTLQDIRLEVKSNPAIDVDGLVSDIFRQFDLEEVRSSNDTLDKKMSWQQVRDWVAPGFSIGGHSHTHAILSFLSPADLAWELDHSLDMLLRHADIATKHYSYPEGLAHCYSPQVITALKDRGITCSPTAIDGVNPPGSDPFHLRRVMVS